ncbi:MAG: hypothetical protein K0Q72_2107 [Armatimonadetes bacterium]|jgi:small multidrug resistance family-3 protein|nr:hypothetical protein [Armatimonadota bacterium]
MIREIVTIAALLLLAALLEAGGDALIRFGLRGAKWGLWAGAVALVVYGFVVNLARWDFGRLMGVYIAIFFVVSQALAVVVFREKLHAPSLLGGALIIAGGLVLTFWVPAAK